MNEYEPNPMLQNIIKKPKRPNKWVLILGGIVFVLLIVILFLALRKPEVITTEVERKQNLNEIALELEYFISENKLDALDSYGYDNLARVAIVKMCYGVNDCNSVQGDVVKEYISNVFDTEVTFSNINCELNDGVLYSYDSVNNVFVFTGEHAHGGLSIKPIYTKVNSIKRKGNKFELVLNKLYYNPDRSDYITTDPLGINRVYDSNDYMHMTNNGENIDMTKLSANYENNFDTLKNTGTRYSYTFGQKNGHYILERYEVINEEE